MHILDITYHTTNNCGTLKIEDNSTYDILQPVTNTILEVKPPGKTCYIPFILVTGWCSKILNCSDLQSCCGNPTSSVLPDGIYAFKYSVDPNLSMMIEMQHLRICQLNKSYVATICELQNNRYKLLKKDYKTEIDRLYYVRGMIQDAVSMVEECLDQARGMELYNEAKLMLEYGCQSCK